MPPSEILQFHDDRVAVIIGRQSYAGMETLIQRMPVWAPDLPHYRQIAERVRDEQSATGLTLYECDDSLSPEEEFLSLLSTIDLHHGEYSANPWTTLEVYGATLTGEISASLEEYGAHSVVQTSFGFSAARGLN